MDTAREVRLFSRIGNFSRGSEYRNLTFVIRVGQSDQERRPASQIQTNLLALRLYENPCPTTVEASDSSRDETFVLDVVRIQMAGQTVALAQPVIGRSLMELTDAA